MTMTVRCFGDFIVDVDGRPIERWGAGRARPLFQYLLLNRDQVVRRELLYETLWPGTEWSPTASSLKVAVHALRRALRECSADSVTPPVRIVSKHQGYVAYAGDLWMDVTEFEDTITEGRVAEAQGEHAHAMTSYRHAAGLYTGDFLPAETGTWATDQRECSRAHMLYALGYLRADAVRRGDHPETIILCRRTLEVDPYHEETYQTLIMIHGRRGELGQVQNWHRICVGRLRDELNVAPAVSTQRIFDKAVRGELRTPAAAVGLAPLRAS